MWSTATDLLRWGQALNADELGISALIQTPGRLDDGTPIDYAWASVSDPTLAIASIATEEVGKACAPFMPEYPIWT